MTYRCRRAVMAALIIGLFLLPAPALARQAETSVQDEAVRQDEAIDVGQELIEEAHEVDWLQPIGKTFNFALLAGVLIYFARAPISRYLTGRSEAIRRDLAEAAALRRSAESQLQAVRSRLAELPGDLVALEAGGREELAHEQARMTEATARERAKMLESTHREIDIQRRLARRQLVEHTADLAMGLARRRIETSITAEDQARLVDRYASEVRS
jgi:F-type H+-transporting ATPase subunit b